MSARSKQKIEFGDFQTPPDLSDRICRLLFEQGYNPSSVIEPTCGRGNLLLSALDQFPTVTRAVGVDINLDYVQQVKERLHTRSYPAVVQVFQGDFFEVDWRAVLAGLPDPLLVIGNPPWVTSSGLSSVNGNNLPPKTNLHRLSGLDAKTGKSNFDISEWMLIHILELLNRRAATVAMLCKTSVARKVLSYAWQRNFAVGPSRLYLIDARKSFKASVDACLLVCDTAERNQPDQVCKVYEDLSQDAYRATFGYRGDRLIANMEYYERWRHLEKEKGNAYRWRSGIKHDCSIVMELEKENRGFRNRLGELCDLEGAYIYPMLKSSDVAGTGTPHPSRWMLVPQKAIGRETDSIKHTAPKTWAYLTRHGELLAGRRSSVYAGRPPFSIFGVGDYSFAPWKVAISGLYKKLNFAVVGPYAGKPVVLDDTCYFLPCQSKEEAHYLAGLLNSETAQEFFQAFIFWDAKRPITIGVLGRLDMVALARELGSEDTIRAFLSVRQGSLVGYEQMALFNG